MNQIVSYEVNKNNICFNAELKPNEAIVVCNHYIKEQLEKKGAKFDEMYPGVFIVTSIKGKSTMGNIEGINKIIILYNSKLFPDNNLVAQMSLKKMDEFFQKYYWADKQKKELEIKCIEYRDRQSYYEIGSLIVTYKDEKSGNEYQFSFRDSSTQLTGWTENWTRIEDIWRDYLFNETVKPYLEKNKFRLSLKSDSDSNKIIKPNDSKAQVEQDYTYV